MITLEERVKNLESQLALFMKSDGFTVGKKLQILDGRNIQAGKTTGTSIGTEVTQKLSVYGVTPVIQASSISAPTGGATVDSQSRTAINSLITAIKNFGISA